MSFEATSRTIVHEFEDGKYYPADIPGESEGLNWVPKIFRAWVRKQIILGIQKSSQCPSHATKHTGSGKSLAGLARNDEIACKTCTVTDCPMREAMQKWIREHNI